MFFLMLAVAFSTLSARPMISISVLAQVGQEIILIDSLSSPIDFSISYATYISSTGSAVKETLIVSPIPFRSI